MLCHWGLFNPECIEIAELHPLLVNEDTVFTQSEVNRIDTVMVKDTILYAAIGESDYDYMLDSALFKIIYADSVITTQRMLMEIGDTLPPVSIYRLLSMDSLLTDLEKEVIYDSLMVGQPVSDSGEDIEEMEFNKYMSTEKYFIGNVFMNDPTFDTTAIFDPVSANPYNIDFTKKTDSALVKLTDNYCTYYHPNYGEITSPYGPRWRTFHKGVDLKLNTGDSVFCAFEGVVRVSHRSRSYGNVVMVRHKNGLETIYAHLSKLLVGIGEHVEAGDLVGLGGNTGHSFGSHLHFEVRYKGEPLNPTHLISFEQKCLFTDSVMVCKDSFRELHNFIADRKRIKYHTVRRGESLGVIARKRHTSVSSLCKLNKISRKTTLRVGRKLRYI